jgi:hypothetical protein
MTAASPHARFPFLPDEGPGYFCTNEFPRGTNEPDATPLDRATIEPPPSGAMAPLAGGGGSCHGDHGGSEAR